MWSSEGRILSDGMKIRLLPIIRYDRILSIIFRLFKVFFVHLRSSDSLDSDRISFVRNDGLRPESESNRTFPVRVRFGSTHFSKCRFGSVRLIFQNVGSVRFRSLVTTNGNCRIRFDSIVSDVWKSSECIVSSKNLSDRKNSLVPGIRPCPIT
jgi:hypothetical protein